MIKLLKNHQQEKLPLRKIYILVQQKKNSRKDAKWRSVVNLVEVVERNPSHCASDTRSHGLAAVTHEVRNGKDLGRLFQTLFLVTIYINVQKVIPCGRKLWFGRIMRC